MPMYTQVGGCAVTWVHERIYAAGGDFIPENWGSFSDQTGVDAIVHLSPKLPQKFQGPPANVFLWMDLIDERQAGMEERTLVAGFIQKSLQDGRRVLLHSSLGRHRVRWIYVAYLIQSGQTTRAALRQGAERPWLAPYKTDKELWARFESLIRSSR
jgi:hypothetical protein